MSLAHLTLPTRAVEQTTAFFEYTLGYVRDPVPANVPDETVWLNIGRGQQMHVFVVEGFEVSPFERFIFREPVNGYVFEIIDLARSGRAETS